MQFLPIQCVSSPQAGRGFRAHRLGFPAEIGGKSWRESVCVCVEYFLPRVHFRRSLFKVSHQTDKWPQSSSQRETLSRGDAPEQRASSPGQRRLSSVGQHSQQLRPGTRTTSVRIQRYNKQSVSVATSFPDAFPQIKVPIEVVTNGISTLILCLHLWEIKLSNKWQEQKWHTLREHCDKNSPVCGRYHRNKERQLMAPKHQKSLSGYKICVMVRTMIASWKYPSSILSNNIKDGSERSPFAHIWGHIYVCISLSEFLQLTITRTWLKLHRHQLFF